MAAETGAAGARVGSIVAVLLALVALVAGTAADARRAPDPEPLLAQVGAQAAVADPDALRMLAARVNDPDTAIEVPDAARKDRDAVRDRLADRRVDRGSQPAGRLLERLRSELRVADRGAETAGPPLDESSDSTAWPDPTRLRDQLVRLATVAGDVGTWATATLAHVDAVRETAGPADPAAAAALLPLDDDVEAGMALADRLADPALASDVRRAALAAGRRVAVWRAAAAACAPPAGSGAVAATALVTAAAAPMTVRLLGALERFESAPAAAAAARVHEALDSLGAAEPAGGGVTRAVGDHYLAPNLRVAVHQSFVERLLPAATQHSGPIREFVLGRPVRGTQRVQQTTGVRFVPDPDEIRMELRVDGVVSSRSVTESGPVALHSRATGRFTIHKPMTVSSRGLAFGQAVGAASNRSRLAGIRTDFDSLPIMGSLMRSIARNQHDDHYDEATREVNDKIVSRACHEIDAATEPRFRDLAERVRTKAWEPMVRLGLAPTAVGLETTADMAVARVRLAGARQLAAHTPRPRAPADALLSVQVHESSVNNACECFGFGGRRLTVAEVVRTVCDRLALPTRIPDDLPADVEVAFAAEEPLRVECRDGLVHVRLALDAIESDRRAWYDIVAQVAYRPVMAGPQVLLERDGPVRLSGAGQQGRMELALRTIFGKLFPKERPVPLLPERLVGDKRLADVRAVQAVSTDGWLALAIARPTQLGGKPVAPKTAQPAAGRRVLRR